MAKLTVAEVLDRAADLIEPEGAWTQRVAYRMPNGKAAITESEENRSKCMCILGAMWRVGERVDGPASKFFEIVTGKWPSNWNDVPGRTQAEVVAKLREAASLAREQKA